MKKLVFSLIALVIAQSTFALEVFHYDEFGFIGLAAGNERKMFKGEKDQTFITPLAYYDNAKNRVFTLDGPQLYVPLLNLTSIHALGFSGFFRANESFSDGNDLFDGIDERQPTLEAGIYIGNQGFNLRINQDIADVHGGNEVTLYIGPAYRHENLIIAPSLTFNQKSAKLTNYYYSLTDEESSQLGLPRYSATTSLLVSPSLRFFYLIGDIQLHLFFEQTHAYKGIEDSPIIETNFRSSILIGLSYIFAG